MRRISVLAEDIAQGDRRMAASCPLARAISRACGVEASVGARSATIYQGGQPTWIDVPLPSEAVQFRWDYDEGRMVAPFVFALKV